jgi:carbon-monoxide dehydrogenase medium subunit
MEYLIPGSVQDAIGLLGSDAWGTKAVAGGTAVVLMMRQGLIAPDRLVALNRLPGLRGVTVESDVVRIGALTSLTEVARSPAVQKHAASVAVAAGLVANPRIRNAATLGGNLAEADYASDPPSALIAWDARCRVQGPNGERSIAVADLITGFYTTALAHDELITAIEIPRVVTGDVRSSYLKYRSRSSEDRPCVGVAARVVWAGDVVAAAEVVVGAVTATPHRLPDVTAALVGSPLSAAAVQATASAYAESVDPIEDFRGSAWYRRRVVDVHVRRALEAVGAPLAVAS